MSRFSWILILAIMLIFSVAIVNCIPAGNSGNGESDSGDNAGGGDDAGGGGGGGGGADDAGTDDAGTDDAGTDDAADDAGDDASNPPAYPDNHNASWDCYLCHADTALGAPQEPHSHAFNAPADCVMCHQAGTSSPAPSGPNAPATHDPSLDCLSCHPQQHGKNFTEKAECFVCHTVGSGSGGGAPDIPSNHKTTWGCFTCHNPVLGNAPLEPHGTQYTPPGDCVSCHQTGSSAPSPAGPAAPNGHNQDMNCLSCHSNHHSLTWQEAAECLVCHNGGNAGAAPQFSQNHGLTWNCYICHQTAFNGAPGEPHSHAYPTAPSECLLCHTQGSSVYSPPNPGMTGNCLNCHAGHHGKTWQSNAQCSYCHSTTGGGDDDAGG